MTTNKKKKKSRLDKRGWKEVTIFKKIKLGKSDIWGKLMEIEKKTQNTRIRTSPREQTEMIIRFEGRDSTQR